jgi:transcriptional regulator with XRE-family HTH domain
MIKERISLILNKLLQELGETQEGLATRLGIAKSNLQGYLKGTNLPGIDVLIKIAELAGLTTDALLKTDNPKMNVNVNNSRHVTIAGGDIYQNTTVKRTNHYAPGVDDISGDQANKLKEYVNKIVELEGMVKQKPKTYGAVWNALNRKMGVTYYREIKAYQYSAAETYLMQWAGRLKRGLKRTDEDVHRKERQKAIFAAARNQLGWTKDALDGYIYECYKKESIRDLTKQQLEQLYNKIFSKKRNT